MAKREAAERPFAAAAESDDPKETVVRISLPLKADGAVDWGRMRESTRQQVQDKLRNDPTLAGGGAGKAAPAASGDTFPEPLALMVLDMLGQVEVAAVMGATHCTRDEAAVFLYTDTDKAIITGPFLKVLDKYGAKWLNRYTDEVVLAALLISIHAPKVIAFQERAAEKPPKTGRPAPFEIVKQETVESS